MPKKKHRKKAPRKSKKAYRSNIPESASTTRFLIFLVIGLVLLAIFYYLTFVMGGYSSLEDELSRENGRPPQENAQENAQENVEEEANPQD